MILKENKTLLWKHVKARTEEHWLIITSREGVVEIVNSLFNLV